MHAYIHNTHVHKQYLRTYVHTQISPLPPPPTHTHDVQVRSVIQEVRNGITLSNLQQMSVLTELSVK